MKLSAEQAFNEGIRAHKCGDLETAELMYRSVLDRQPTNADAHHNLGILASFGEEPNTALIYFKKALEINPKVTQFWFSYLDALIKLRKVDMADNLYKKALEFGLTELQLQTVKTKLEKIKQSSNAREPEQVKINRLLSLYKNGKNHELLDLAQDITKSYPFFLLGWKTLGAARRRIGDKVGAAEAFKKAVKLSPSDHEAQNNLGVALKELHRLEEACDCYQKAAELNPNYASAHCNLGNVLLRLNKLEAAERSCRTAINLKQVYPEAYNNLGNVLKALDRTFDAENAYKKAIAQDRSYKDAYYNLGIIQKGTGRLKEAELSYRKALMVSPRFANAHNNLGNVLRELERPEEAKESFLQAISCDATYIDAHFNLGVLLHEYGDFDGSEKSLRNAIKLEDNHAEAHSSLGNTLKELGKLGEAEASYTKAIALRPGHTDALQNRGLLYLEKKDYAAALEDFNESNSEASSAYALAALYALGRTEDICRRLKSRQKEDKYNLRVAAFSSFFSNVSKKETANEFCSNPLDLLYFSNISAHLGESESFSEGVIQELRGIENIWEPNSRTTNKGFQSKAHVNIFESEATQIKRLESIVTSELDSFYSKFKNITCTLIKEWPANYRLRGWYVILNKFGYQDLHIHPSGWLSGVIYLKVVPSLKRNEGSIEFGLDSSHYSHMTSPKFVYEPKLGDIVLFPSSLYHKTIPFTTDAERIIVSFDLKPIM